MVTIGLDGERGSKKTASPQPLSKGEGTGSWQFTICAVRFIVIHFNAKAKPQTINNKPQTASQLNSNLLH